jgi:predicted nucleotidyltransferase
VVKSGKLDLKIAALHQSEAQALLSFVDRLQQSFPHRILQLSLFGSKARGESGPDSDVDVLVIVDQDDRALRRGIIDIASELSLEYEVLLSPKVIGVQRWKTVQGFRLYQNIARDALPIPVRQIE